MIYKLFIIEDDAGVSEGISDIAMPFGFDVKICGDFLHVTEEFSEFAPHIVLLDIGLPFAGGFHRKGLWKFSMKTVSLKYRCNHLSPREQR